jgi:flagellar hook-associated protein 2
MASTISFAGLSSGIDFGQVRDAIIANEMQPVTQLQNQAATYGNKVAGMQQLNASLVTLTSAADALISTTLGTSRTATPSDSTILTASASSLASAGAINVTVNRLATALTQVSLPSGSTSAPILAGGATQATFQLQKGGASTGPTSPVCAMQSMRRTAE